MSLDADLDTLYGVPPQEFTALRKQLAVAARKRGDIDAATAIAAARRPTVAAWVVNVLIRSDPTARTRIAELTAALRAAHAAMDGARIRELSTQQRKLVSELARAGLVAADVENSTSALRDDVTNTLAAAIADPEVAGRLGRLERAQEWSGFGDFGLAVAPEFAVEPAPASDPEPEVDTAERRQEATRRRAEAAADVERAERIHAEAVAAVTDRREAVAAALLRYEELLAQLGGAEHQVDIVGAELADAKTALAQADSEIATISGESPT
ncbi:hypothetical protein [Mycobacterium sp. C31M]